VFFFFFFHTVFCVVHLRKMFGCVFKETYIKHAYFEKTQEGVELASY
jgi:hypothetical protein